jgi:CrcB protein
VKLVLAVALGGALGAVGRYFFTGYLERWLAALIGDGFPYGTIAVNVIGSFALGALVEALAFAVQISPELRAFVVVGVLGSFTTFSAFSLDTMLLVERGEIGRAGLYVAASVVLSVGGFLAALRLFRWILA